MLLPRWVFFRRWERAALPHKAFPIGNPPGVSPILPTHRRGGVPPPKTCVAHGRKPGRVTMLHLTHDPPLLACNT